MNLFKLFFFSLLFSSYAVEALSAELSCRLLSPIQQGFLNQHIVHKKLTPELEKRVVKQYIKNLDGAKLYFLKSDIKSISNFMHGFFKKLKKQDCQALNRVKALYIQRVSQRLEFAKKTLKDKKFAIDKKTEFVFDPDERDYANNKTEVNKFHKKYLQFQVSNYLATDMKMDEAKKHVIKNYERILRRTKERTSDDIYANYLDAFAHSLDPHSSFFSKDVLEDFEIGMRLSLEGIGATLSSQDGFTVIEQLVPGGAAERSGLLKSQDKIVAVGQGKKGKMVNVIEQELRDVVRKIRGKKGTTVKLTILRKKGAGKGRFTISLVRDKIKLEDDAAAIHYIDKKIGKKKMKLAVLILPSFYADSRRGGRSSAKDLKKLLKEAKKNKVDGVLFDLSNNGGGSLDDAVKIAGLFFKTGNVVKQSSRNPARGEIALKDVDKTVDFDGPLVVLTSRISASASEIVAGTLQDYGRAVIVGGDHTFGKGSVQSVMPIPQNLGALKVTVGMFFIPGGKSTQHRGVDADITIPSIYSNNEIGEKTLDYSLPPKAITKFISKDAYVTSGKGSWRTIEKAWLPLLSKKSKERVEKSEDFKKIKEDIKKSKERGKVVKLSETLKDRTEKEEKREKNRNLSREERTKEYLKSAGVQEGVNILADLVELYGTKKTVIGKKERK